MTTEDGRFTPRRVNVEKEALRYLSRLLNPVKLARALGIDPDPWQAGLLLSNEKRVILNCARQSGKSTIAAILALHHALRDARSLVLVLSRSQRQSGELFRKIASFYKDLGKPVPSDVETALTLQLANGSRIVSLPGTDATLRGFSAPSLIVVDEAARCPDQLYYAVRPMLAVSQGRLILLSTPNGRSGFFYEEWTGGEERWMRVRVTADECPRIAKGFLATERTKGEHFFNQEYLCEFRENVDSYFTLEEIENAFSPEVKPLFDENGEIDIVIPDKPIRRGMIGTSWEPW